MASRISYGAHMCISYCIYRLDGQPDTGVSDRATTSTPHNTLGMGTRGAVVVWGWLSFE